MSRIRILEKANLIPLKQMCKRSYIQRLRSGKLIQMLWSTSYLRHVLIRKNTPILALESTRALPSEPDKLFSPSHKLEELSVKGLRRCRLIRAPQGMCRIIKWLVPLSLLNRSLKRTASTKISFSHNNS